MVAGLPHRRRAAEAAPRDGGPGHPPIPAAEPAGAQLRRPRAARHRGGRIDAIRSAGQGVGRVAALAPGRRTGRAGMTAVDNAEAMRQTQRLSQIAAENRLPLINLVESGGADLPSQSEIFIPGGRVFRDLTAASAARLPTIAVVFGTATAGGAYIPGMSDYTIFVAGQAKVF